MRKPREGPKFLQLLEKIIQPTPVGEGELPRYPKLFERTDEVTLEQYLHWDDLWHREPPHDLSREEWWFLIKAQRQSLKQFIPLLDKSGGMMNFVISGTILQNLHQIDMRAGGQIRMPEEVINPETKDAYYVSSLIEEAITSSQLEGATTTRQVAKEMLRTGRAPRDRSERMILNNFLTMKRIGALKDKPLNRELILEIHRLVTYDTLHDATAAGRFRRDDEAVGVYDNVSNALMHLPPHGVRA